MAGRRRTLGPRVRVHRLSRHGRSQKHPGGSSHVHCTRSGAGDMCSRRAGAYSHAQENLIMQLSDIEVRILGCLMEKEATTPDNYPLSLNALTSACNQLTNREPVMALGEDQVKWAVNSLRQQSLVRAIQPSDARVMKFQHLLADKLDLDQPARAVLCVLMLRGPQTLNEIKTRTNRLAEFTSAADVEAVVRELISGELVVEMARQPGQKEV